MRNSLHIFLLAAISQLLISSCSQSSSGTIDLLPLQKSGSQTWVLVSPDGVESPDSSSAAPSMVVNGFYTIADSAGISVRRIGQTDPTPSGFTGLASAGAMTENRIPVVKPNHRIELLDRDAVTIATLQPVDGHEIDAVNPFFSSGRMIFHLADDTPGGHFGAIDTDGNIVIDPIYDRLYPFHGDFALAARDTTIVTTRKKGKKKETVRTIYSLLDRSGNEHLVLPEGMRPISEGVYREIMPVEFNDSLGFINTRGQIINVPADIKEILQTTDRCYAYKNARGLHGVMSIEGDTILRPIFTDITIIDDDHFIVFNDEMTSPMLVNPAMDVLAEFNEDQTVFSLSPENFHSAPTSALSVAPGATHILYMMPMAHDATKPSMQIFPRASSLIQPLHYVATW